MSAKDDKPDGGKAGRLGPIRGVARLARGQVDGMAGFRGTPDGFLASLAPLIAFPVAGSLLLLMQGQILRAATAVLVTLTAQLAPPVLSHALARLWGRQAQWLRYATAYNWCQWAILAAMLVLLIVLEVAMDAGLPDSTASQVFAGGIAAYALWLHWTLARHGLEVSRLRAAVAVVVVNVGTLLLVFGPLVAKVMLAQQTGQPGSAP